MPRMFIVALLCLMSLVAHAQDKQDKKSAQNPKPAQTPSAIEQDDVVRITTELVQTDVMVFDKDGRFVEGLKPEQFELLIDGKPQSIAFFETVVMGGRNERSVLKAARENKPSSSGTGDSDESARGRTILFFINDLHLQPSSFSRAHKLISNFIDKQLGPNDQIAITSSSGQIGFLQQLTDNPAVLPVHERLRGVFDPRTQRSRALRLFCSGNDKGD